MKPPKHTDFEIVMKHLKHLTYDQKVAVAKVLALTEGVQMYTPSEARKFIDQEVARELETRMKAEKSRILVP